MLFAPDLVEYLLGDAWEGATVLLQGLGAASALYSLGYTWIAFARGLGRVRQPAVEALAAIVVFAAVAVPAYLVWGRTAYALAIVGSSLAILAVRTHFVRGLLPGVDLGALVWRCAWPVALAAVPPVAVRLAGWGGDRDAVQVVVELTSFLVTYAALVIATERPLLSELRGLRRAQAEPDPVGAAPSATEPAVPR